MSIKQYRLSLALIVSSATIFSLPVMDAEETDVELARDVMRQVMQCWPGVDDLPQPWRLSVTVETTMEADGSLTTEPTVEAPRAIDASDEIMSEAIHRAINAVTACAPYSLRPNTMDWPQPTKFIFYSPIKPPLS